MDQSLTASPSDVHSINTDVHSHCHSVIKARAQEVHAKLSLPLQSHGLEGFLILVDSSPFL